jgi:hypothetical protein
MFLKISTFMTVTSLGFSQIAGHGSQWSKA